MKYLLPLLLLVGCATAQLDLPADALPVEGSNPRWWNRPIAFGEWRTSMVDEGTTRSFLADLDVVQVGKTDQAYRMLLNDVFIECHTREIVIGRSGFFLDPNLGNEPLLVCGLDDDDGSRSVLALSRTGKVEPALRGELRGVEGGPSLEVRSIHRIGSSIPSGEPFGYEILRDGRRVAAVETINRGRVWIASDAPDRDTLAATAAALLLFRDPDAGSMD